MPTDVITENTAAQNASADNTYTGVDQSMLSEGAPDISMLDGTGILGVVENGSGNAVKTLLRFTGLSNIPSSATVTSATV